MKDSMNKETGAQVYELGYLLLPSIAEEAISGIEAKLKALIAKVGGTELVSEVPEHIDLAYTMTKTVGGSRYVVNEAYIGWVKFEAFPEQVEGLRAEVANMEEVLRSLLVKAPRETTFTFAKARAAIAEKIEAEEAEAEAAKGAAVVE